MNTCRRSLSVMQIACAILLMIISVLLLIVLEMKVRLVDADLTSLKMCNVLGRLVAHVEKDGKGVLSASLHDFVERGAYRRNLTLPILDRNRNAGSFKAAFEASLQGERKRMSRQSRDEN